MRRRFCSSKPAMSRKIVRWPTPSPQLCGRLEREEVEVLQVWLDRLEARPGWLLRVEAQEQPAREPPCRDEARIGSERCHVALRDELLPEPAAQAIGERQRVARVQHAALVQDRHARAQIAD